jgi:superfamily II DNA or RNA helicase
MNLRPYQSSAIERFKSSTAPAILLVSPTGSGKTVMFAAITEEYARGLKSVLIIGHRREIIWQTSNKLRDRGIAHGIIMAGEKPRPLERVQVAMIQTLHVRIKSKRLDLPEADLIIIDEAHHAPAGTYQKIIDAYPNAKVLGLTATPCRADGRGLGGIFDELIDVAQVPDLIEQGHLVRTRTYGQVAIDLRGVPTRQGDYAVPELADRMNTDRLVGNIVVHWLKYGEGRKTVVFAVNVAHSVHIRDELIAAGIRAEHIDGTTPKAERDETLARLRRGEIQIVVNCMVLTEGWDMPEVGCCVLARPTKQLGLYRQMLGRVLRPAPGKIDAIVIDHAGAYRKLGFAEDRIEWTLDPDEGAVNRTQVRREHNGDRFVDCVECGTLREGGKPCPHCGFLPQTRAHDYQVREGELGLVDQNRVAQQPVYDAETRRAWYAMLIRIAEEGGYKSGWASVNYNKKFGEWPPRHESPPISITPSLEVRNWVKSQMIAYAKAKSRAA